jgi:predicted O-methyltransferase YrrM
VEYRNLRRLVPKALWERATNLLPAPPLRARDRRWSAIGSLEDDATAPTDDLVALGLAAAQAAREMTLESLIRRCTDEAQARTLARWPGEHYRLLAGLARVVAPRRIVEVGTATGAGTLALLEGAPDARVITYDLRPWETFAGNLLRPEDIGSGRIEQRLGNLLDVTYFCEQEADLRAADLIFVDAPKDRIFEPAVLPMIAELMRPHTLLVLDDIRLLPMVTLWEDLRLRKLDLTSLGHWSGTGIARRP